MLCLAFLLSSFILIQNPDDLQLLKRKKLIWRRNYGTINGSGVNLEEFQFEILEKSPTFSMVSRITGSKGVNEFIQAAFYVKQKYPNAKFNLIGPMDDEDTSIDMKQLKKAIQKGIVNVTGRVEDVRPFLKQSRVFVLPSYYPEGIPDQFLKQWQWDDR